MGINGTRILVTGGAGLIGSSAIDLLLHKCVPPQILVLDDMVRGSLANLERAPKDPRVTFIRGDICDIIVAKNRRAIFFSTEFAWTIVNIGRWWICIQAFSLISAGIAFFASYVFHWALMYPIVRHLTGFRWSPDNLRLITLFVGAIAVAFCTLQWLPLSWAIAVGGAIAVTSGMYSIRRLLGLVSSDTLLLPL